MKMQVNDWLALLAVFFSVGDIIGATRMKRVEQAWLQYATQFFIFIFRQFSRAKQASLSIAPLLISVTILFLFLLPFPLLLMLFTGVKIGTHMFYVLELLYVVLVILSGLASSELMEALRNRALFYQNGYFTNESLYFELGIQQRIVEVLITSQERKEQAIETLRKIGPVAAGAGRGYSGVALMELYATFQIIILSLVAVLSSIFRMIAFIGFLVIWAVLFLPARLLNNVAVRSGSESFFNVGKYLVLVAVFIYSLMLNN